MTLSIILTFALIYFLIELTNTRKNPFSGKIPIAGLEEIGTLPHKNSLLTLIIYLSHRAGDAYMKESIYWNKLYRDIPREDIFMVGMILGNEEPNGLVERHKLLFPIGYDKNLLLTRSMLISFAPYRIIMNQRGKILYSSPSMSHESSHEEFYFHVVELLKKTKEVQFQRSWKIR